MSWSLPSSDGGAEITQYNVYRGTSSGSYSFLDHTSNIVFKDSSVIRGTVYYYVVTALNSFGESAYSNEVNVTPSVLPESTISTTAETTESDGFPSITSSSSFLTTLLFFGVLVVFISRFRKRK